MAAAKNWVSRFRSPPVEQVNSFAIPVTEFLLMLAGACYFG
jgi:hypothetical protein